MKLVDANEIIRETNEIFKDNIYKTLFIQLVNSTPGQPVLTTDDGKIWLSNCNQYICSLCKYSTEETWHCEKCFALEDGRMRKFSPKNE